MKLLWLALILAGCHATLQAQTNPPAPAAKTSERAPTKIFSDTGDFDLKALVAVYRGHVRVEDPQMILTCDVLTARIPEPGARIDRIVAEQNVVIDATDDKGRTNRATGDKAVYTYKVEGAVTNETVELTGHARLDSAQGWLTGEPIVWDKANNRVHATNQKMIFRASGTNQIPGAFEKTANSNK